MLCGLPAVHCILGTLREFTQNLRRLYQFQLLLSLMERRTYHTAVQVFKILHEIALPYLHDMFHYAFETTGHVGRNPL